MKRAREGASASMAKAASAMKRFYDRRHSQSPEYKIGDLVYLEASHLRTDRPSRKLDDRRLGPLKRWARAPSAWNSPPPGHASTQCFTLCSFDLTALRCRLYNSARHRHPKVEVEDVLDERTRRGRTEYLVS